MKESETNDDIPGDEWSLEQLGQFCRLRRDRIAIDAWLIGKALTLAKQMSRRRFGAWLNEQGYSASTACRYMRLYRSYESPDQVAGRGLVESLEELRQEEGSNEESPIIPHQEAAPIVQVRQHGSVEGSPSQSPDQPYPFLPTSEGDDKQIGPPGKVVPVETIVIDETSDRLAELQVHLESASRLIDWLTAQDLEHVRREWPREASRMRTTCVELRGRLDRLAEIAPEHVDARSATTAA